MTKQEKAMVLGALGQMAVALGQVPDSNRQKVYIEHLSDLPLSAVLAGIKKTIETWEYNSFPPVGVIRKFAGATEGPKALEDQAAVAWDRLRCLKQGYKREALEDPIIYKCFLCLGGRGAFGMWDYDKQEQWKRKQFIDLYQTYSRTMGAGFKELTHEESSSVLARFTERGILKHG